MQNLTQSNGGKYAKNREKKKGLQGECRVLPSFQEQGDFEKTNTELFPFLAAISVQGQGLETGPN